MQTMSTKKKVKASGASKIMYFFKKIHSRRFATSITIPNSITRIKQQTFFGCSKLTSVVIPDSVTTIGDSAFSGCSSLTSIVIPDSVTTIGRFAFQLCTSLTRITFKDTSTWYITSNITDWKNKTGGAKITVTDVSTNAIYFISTYYNYFWYKK